MPRHLHQEAILSSAPVLEKAKYEAWPELHWDESRDERIEKPRGPPTNPLGLYNALQTSAFQYRR